MRRTSSWYWFGVLAWTLKGAPALAALTASLAVNGVGEGRSYTSCSEFQGTHENASVWLEPRVRGGNGAVELTLVWNFGGGYQAYSEPKEFTARLRPGRSFRLDLPALREDVPDVQQSVLLIARDLKSGETADAEVIFPVSRSVILAPASDPASKAKDCFERYPAEASTVGVLTNGSTNISSLLIKQGIERLWGSSHGTSWGFYISPLSVIPVIGSTLGNLFSLNREYFSMVSKQTSETVEVSTEYQLSPGDTIQIHTQKTRNISHYDAILVDSCGKRTVMKGAYPLQWWGFAYHAVPVNPFDPAPPNPANIGGRPMNTCPRELTPDANDSGTPFFKTNP